MAPADPPSGRLTVRSVDGSPTSLAAESQIAAALDGATIRDRMGIGTPGTTSGSVVGPNGKSYTFELERGSDGRLFQIRILDGATVLIQATFAELGRGPNSVIQLRSISAPDALSAADAARAGSALYSTAVANGIAFAKAGGGEDGPCEFARQQLAQAIINLLLITAFLPADPTPLQLVLIALAVNEVSNWNLQVTLLCAPQ